jgi:hypothetical protein
VITKELAERGKEHGLSPAMTEELFWAFRHASNGVPVHAHAVGRERRTVEALDRRRLLRWKRDSGRVLSAKGRRLAERMFA